MKINNKENDLIHVNDNDNVFEVISDKIKNGDEVIIRVGNGKKLKRSGGMRPHMM